MQGEDRAAIFGAAVKRLVLWLIESDFDTAAHLVRRGCCRRRMTLDAAHSVVVQPAPPPHQSKPGKRRLVDAGRSLQHSMPGKRFSVRDGFHLHDRNQELKESIDRRLFPPAVAKVPTEPCEPDINSSLDTTGPSAKQIPHQPSHSWLIDDSKAENGCWSRVEARGANPTNRIERIASILDRISLVEDKEQHAQPRIPSHRSSLTSTVADGGSNIDPDTPPSESLMLPSAEWLIYRHRPNASQWQQVKMEKLLRDTLQKDEQQQQEVHTPGSAAAARILPRPRHQSTLGSTYAERVAAARHQRQRENGEGSVHRPDFSGRAIVGASVTEKERHLVDSREANNKDVDRLLLSLFQSPDPAAAGSVVATPPLSTTRFSTRRSELREQTAAALKSRNLRSRVDELRSLPDLIAKIESIHRFKQQQLVQEHGEDLVRKNRHLARLSVLQRPAETSMFPSAVDQKLHLATKRKKELDEAQETAVRNAVSRWQKRRREQQELQAKRFRESQWLLIVMLAQSSDRWLKAFHLFKKKRDALSKVLMAKRIQKYWRQNNLVRQNSLALLSFAPQTPITSPFYRMPIVLKAIRLVQRFIRRWLEAKRRRERCEAAAIIVTSWFEFQDVKFRRLILRFRKRVRDFQIMWREWRAITDARVKLLLLVWTKLEKKTKRRHGLATPLNDAQSSSLSPREAAHDESRTLTLVEYFRVANDRNTAGGATAREQKRMEGMHRHLRNCGTVQAPIDVVAAAGNGSNSISIGTEAAMSPTSPAAVATTTASAVQASSPTKPQPPPAAKVVKRNMKLVQNMGEEFQLAMYDFYTTTKSPKTSSKPRLPSSIAKKAPLVHGEDQRSAHQQKSSSSPKQQAQSPPSTRGKPKGTSSPTKQASLLSLLAGVGGGPRPNEKVPLQLKMALLRQLLSDKRRQFRETREKKRCVDLRHLTLGVRPRTDIAAA